MAKKLITVVSGTVPANALKAKPIIGGVVKERDALESGIEPDSWEVSYYEDEPDPPQDVPPPPSPENMPSLPPPVMPPPQQAQQPQMKPAPVPLPRLSNNQRRDLLRKAGMDHKAGHNGQRRLSPGMERAMRHLSPRSRLRMMNANVKFSPVYTHIVPDMLAPQTPTAHLRRPPSPYGMIAGPTRPAFTAMARVAFAAARGGPAPMAGGGRR